MQNAGFDLYMQMQIKLLKNIIKYVIILKNKTNRTGTMKKILGLFTILMLLTGMMFTIAFAGTEEWSGSGSEEDPYCIGTLAELEALADRVLSGNSYKDKYFRLTADIGSINGEDVTGFSKVIGNFRNDFSGHFDGNSHTVVLQIEEMKEASGIGMFYRIDGGEVKNLTVSGYVILNGYGSDVGGICSDNSGCVINCINKCKIVGSNSLGGICGSNYGIVINCVNYGEIVCRGFINYVGGICGENFGEIVNCVNTHDIEGEDLAGAGGICGENGGNIVSCRNEGVINGSDRIGGICGENGGSVTNCNNAATVFGRFYTGGICGVSENAVARSSNTGDVSGVSRTGSICGANNGLVYSCSNEAQVKGKYDTGVLCGTTSEGITENCYSVPVEINEGNISDGHPSDEIKAVAALFEAIPIKVTEENLATVNKAISSAESAYNKLSKDAKEEFDLFYPGYQDELRYVKRVAEDLEAEKSNSPAVVIVMACAVIALLSVALLFVRKKK